MKSFNASAWALAHQPLVRFLIVAVLMTGAYSYLQLGQSEDPPFTFRVMVIQALWPGSTAREMEQQVTQRIEKKLEETPNLDYLRSYSKPGEATIFVMLRESAPPKEIPGTWYQVRKKVGDIRETLPPGVVGPFFNDEYGDTFSAIYALTADGFSYADLKDRADRIRDRLLRVDQVAKVEIIGAQDEKIYVEVSSEKLAVLGLSPTMMLEALRTRSDMLPAGKIDAADIEFRVRVTDEFSSLDAIRKIGIRVNNHSYRLGDFAHVYRGYVDPPTFKMRYNGAEAVGLAVSMRPRSNVVDVGRALDATIRQVGTELPIGIDLHSVSDQRQVVQNAMSGFMRGLLEALAIVLTITFLSLGWRAGLVVALCIPLVIAAVFALMRLFDIDLDRISLGALIIALGLLVDDAIIAVEMIARKIDEGCSRVAAATYAYTSTALPMLTGTLITAAAFLPVGLARSRAGEYTFGLFVVVASALLVSWVVAVIFTPYVGYVVLGARSRTHVETSLDSPATRVRGALGRLVNGCIDHRRAVVTASIAAFVLGTLAFRLVEQQFFPASERPELLVDLSLQEGVPFSATEAQVKALEQRLLNDPRVASFVAYIGAGTPRFYLPIDQQLANTNYAQFVVVAKGLDEREGLIASLRATFHDGFPAVRGRVQRLANGPPVSYAVEFRVVGADPILLRKTADQVAARMRANPYTHDVNIDWSDAVPAFSLEVDPDKARALGATHDGIARDVNAMLTGMTVSRLRERDKLIDVVVRAPLRERASLAALPYLNVFTGSNRAVPLAQIAQVVPTFEQGVIWHRNGLPAITVRSDIADNVQAPAVSAQVSRELEDIRATLPAGHRIELGGAAEASSDSQKSIFTVVPLMAFIIVMLLMLQLRSFPRALLVLLTAPLGMIGATAVLLALHVPFGFVAMLGLISLSGMIMRNSLILVHQIDREIAAGSAPREAIIAAVVGRARPIVLTSLAAVLAMVPLSRSVFWGPMAVTIMGGLVVATMLTLFFEPALYAMWYGAGTLDREPRKRARHRCEETVENARPKAFGVSARATSEVDT